MTSRTILRACAMVIVPLRVTGRCCFIMRVPSLALPLNLEFMHRLRMLSPHSIEQGMGLGGATCETAFRRLGHRFGGSHPKRNHRCADVVTRDSLAVLVHDEHRATLQRVRPAIGIVVPNNVRSR